MPGFFSVSVCTNAELLELARARSRKIAEGFPYGASIGGRLLVALKRLPDLTRGFLVSFAEPGAIAPVLIPVIIAILLGTELAGILGALAAMPVAGAIQVTIAELLRQRNYRRRAGALPMR